MTDKDRFYLRAAIELLELDGIPPAREDEQTVDICSARAPRVGFTSLRQSVIDALERVLEER